jgi:hypothetical protein
MSLNLLTSWNLFKTTIHIKYYNYVCCFVWIKDSASHSNEKIAARNSAIKISNTYRYTISYLKFWKPKSSENWEFFMEVVCTPNLAFGPNMPRCDTCSTHTMQVCCVQMLETRLGVAPRQKSVLIRQMILEEVIPGPSSDVWHQPKYDGHHDNDDDIDVPSSPGSTSKV